MAWKGYRFYFAYIEYWLFCCRMATKLLRLVNDKKKTADGDVGQTGGAGGECIV